MQYPNQHAAEVPVLIEIDNFGSWQEAMNFWSKEVFSGLNDHGFGTCSPGNSSTSDKVSLSLPMSLLCFQLVIANSGRQKGWICRVTPGQHFETAGAIDGATARYSMANDVKWGQDYHDG